MEPLRFIVDMGPLGSDENQWFGSIFVHDILDLPERSSDGLSELYDEDNEAFAAISQDVCPQPDSRHWIHSRVRAYAESSDSPHLWMLWSGLSQKRNLPNHKAETVPMLTASINFLTLINRTGSGFFRSDPRFQWNKTKVLPDRQYSKDLERFRLLMLLFQELFIVLGEWGILRSRIVAAIRHKRDLGDIDTIAALLHEYCTGEEWKFEEHLDKILFFSFTIVFFMHARAPSVEERILRYLYDPRFG
ncbi:hypothetical protein BJ508DRAFT_418243 [Ascobolus immersus RN42]|uniref:Uncharacterized protein n=1 Tax=Ascobolus immersus RN42 TaxID=1160509 RepID=A0A3N4HN72_ASCIM|nr:hypothetical protein BJ508DRAFT_418243 [Ascobolus immersus RN42]